jgi:predicted O-linked N-acetylglucosamine transferase (SPINDLY family)
MNAGKGDTLFQAALEHHRAGRKSEASALYDAVLESDPRHANASYLKSVILSEEGRKEAAIAYLERAIGSDPSNPAFHSNLGLLYRGAGRLDDAVRTLQRAVQLKPDLPETSFNLALVLEDRSELDAALECLARAVKLSPGNALFQMRLARVLAKRGKLDEAVLRYQRGLELEPSSRDAAVELSRVFRALGRFDQAESTCRRALAHHPDDPVIVLNLATIWLEQGRLDEAIATYHRLLEDSPDDTAAHANLGKALADSGLVEEGVVSLRRAVELDREDDVTHGMLVYALPFDARLGAEDILAEAQAWNRRHAETLASEVFHLHDNDPAPDRRIRVGYVSPDFRDHCQAFFTLGLLGAHDRREVEVLCYSSVLDSHRDEVTDRIRARADLWRDVAGLDDRSLARLIHEDRVDVCVDLTMHMRSGRMKMFARKPAPLQICWLAYPGTTGLPTMDYRISDPFLDPSDEKEPYAERTLRLPDTFWCYDPLTEEPKVSSLPALAANHVTFGSFNHFSKTNTAVFELWSRVLAQVEGSQMVLLAPEGDSRRRVLDVFVRAGVAASRVRFVSRAPRGEYLKWYQEVDICLDTFPYNGHTTSLDAFWMGVPVVTLVGSTVVGRAGLCQARNLHLPELVSTTPDEFVVRAVALAKDLPALAKLRAGLRERMARSPLMDFTRFAKNLEGAYRTIWRDWCERRSAP